jgi:arylsulfatase A-like enzyme
MGWGDVSCRGSVIQTPNIDGLAKRGVLLDHFYVQPVCSPTRGSLFSGKYPFNLGLQVDVIRPWDAYGLNLDEKVLPQYFKEAGYRTAITGKWHLGLSKQAFLPQNRGFDHTYGHYLGMIDYFTHDRLGGVDWHRNGEVVHEKGYTTELIGAEAVRVVQQHDTSKPLFLYVPFNAPHTPLQAPENYIKKYAHIRDEKRRIYAAMVDCMDVAIGDVVKALEAKGMYRNTLVMFFSDNGGRIREGASNGPLRGGKKMLFEGGIRVPAMIHWPGHIEGGTVNRNVIHVVDILPTLAAVIGVAPGRVDGISVLPALEGKSSVTRDVVPLHIDPARAALRVGKWKLTIGADEPVNGKSSSEVLLFDIEADPNEMTDLKADYPEVVARMKAQIEAYREKSAKPHGNQSQANSSVPKGFTLPKVWGPWLD